MEATAKLRYLRIAPRKVRVVADLIRGQNVDRALSQLAYVEKRSEGVV
jgi:large subunit ribosomal protein L22